MESSELETGCFGSEEVRADGGEKVTVQFFLLSRPATSRDVACVIISPAFLASSTRKS